MIRLKKMPELEDIDVGRVSFRFWQKVQKRGSCFLWLGGADTEGYGKFTINHRSFRAHRVAYFLFYGIDPGDHLVLHRCDTPACVGPRHLFLGDQSDNIRDMDAKGRRGENHQSGERSGRAILSEEEVLRIRQSDESDGIWATRLGVSRGCINHARKGINWRHLV